MDAQHECKRLYSLDYGNWFEFALRFGAIFFASVSFYLYSGWILTWIWYGAYASTHLIYFSFLKLRMSSATTRDLNIASVLLLAIICAFLSFPSYLVLQPDDTMQIGGVGAVGITIVIMVRRSDTPILIIAAEILIVAMIALAILYAILPTLEPLSAKLTLTIIGTAFVAYFAEAIVTTRNQRLRADAKQKDDLQAQKMETLGRMAGGIAHDFNNLLTAIGGNLELYHEVTDQAQRDEFVAEARSAVNSAAANVEQLLVYARRARRTAVLTDVASVLGKVDDLAQTLLPSSVKLTVEILTDRVPIRVDANQMVNSVLNLVTNSRDAMQNGGKIAISYQNSASDTPRPLPGGGSLGAGEYVAIKVSDNGQGIDHDILARVVEPFFTTKGKTLGTGLGLSMVEGFCRSSNGGLSIQSSAAGTNSCIYLPIARENA